MKTADLKKVLRKHFAPKMKDLNYTKVGELSWTKKGPEPFIFSIQIFPSSSGGYCWIEAGVHLSFMPLNSDGKQPDLNKLETINSMFRKHLTNTLNDQKTFIYGEEIEGLEILCEYLFWAVRDEAEILFADFNNFPEPFSSVTVEDIRNRKSYSAFKFGNNIIEAMELGRINLFLGEKEKAVEFANFGLNLINGVRGSGLIAQFEKIRQGELYL